jgi:hypothetical protein
MLVQFLQLNELGVTLLIQWVISLHRDSTNFSHVLMDLPFSSLNILCDAHQQNVVNAIFSVVKTIFL